MREATLLNAGDASGDLHSGWFDLGDLQTFSVQAVFSGGGGDLAGTLTLEATNDTAATPSTVTGSSQAVTTSTNHTWNVNGAGYRYVRAFWDFTSGTGNLTVTFVAKETRVVGA